MGAARSARFNEHHIPSNQQTSDLESANEPICISTAHPSAGPAEKSEVRSNATPMPGANRRRRISPQSGRALEILGHAIEYLADEFALEIGGSRPHPAQDPQLEAIRILMAANRGVYYACPILPTLRERLSAAWLRRVKNFGLQRRGHHARA